MSASGTGRECDDTFNSARPGLGRLGLGDVLYFHFGSWFSLFIVPLTTSVVYVQRDFAILCRQLCASLTPPARTLVSHLHRLSVHP